MSDLVAVEAALHAEKTERLRTESALLRSLLPQSIVERLLGGEKDIAEAHEHVTVLFAGARCSPSAADSFGLGQPLAMRATRSVPAGRVRSAALADVVGFTTMCSTMSARCVVMTMNALFNAFDRQLERFGVFRAEVIGDGYMCAPTAPEPPQRRARSGLIHQLKQRPSLHLHPPVCALAPAVLSAPPRRAGWLRRCVCGHEGHQDHAWRMLLFARALLSEAAALHSSCPESAHAILPDLRARRRPWQGCCRAHAAAVAPAQPRRLAARAAC